MQYDPELSTLGFAEFLESIDWLYSLRIAIVATLESTLPRAPPDRSGEYMVDWKAFSLYHFTIVPQLENFYRV